MTLYDAVIAVTPRPVPAPVEAIVTGEVSGASVANERALPAMAPVTPNAVTRTLLAPSGVPAAGSEYVAVTDHPLLDPVASVTVSTVAPAALDHAPGVGARPTLAPVPAMTSVPGATVATSVSITLPVPAPADAAPAPPITTAR